MNADKYTQNALKAVQEAVGASVRYGNPTVDLDHLLDALLREKNDLIPTILTNLKVDVPGLKDQVVRDLESKPKIGGAAAQPYLSRETDAALNAAEREAESMGDHYTSVEHLMLGLMSQAKGDFKSLLNRFGIERNSFLVALKQVRGNQSVTTDNPEGTYDAMNKYGIDLTQLARDNKLDPVIGRDEETPPFGTDPFTQNQEQPCNDRRAGRGKDGDCGRAGPAHRARGRARKPEKQKAFFPGYGRAAGRREVPGRI